MSRARGANAVLAMALNSGAYGAIPNSGYKKMPFNALDLGEEQGLVANDIIGLGRDPQPPGLDVVNSAGNIGVPVDLRYFGFWLKMLFGAPTTTAGVRASGSIVFSAQPTDDATITINGTDFTFKASGADGVVEANKGATLADSLIAMVMVLNASADADVATATYGLNTIQDTITVTYDTPGTGGNAFTLAASSSPASHGTVSDTTLADGSASGAYSHVFVPGALSLPDAVLELQNPEVPLYRQNFGVVADTLEIAASRSGNLNATIGLIGQGENRLGSSGAGSPTSLAIVRFAQLSGSITRHGAPFADVVSANVKYSNGFDKVEVIRPDGRIAGADPGQITAGLSVQTRFRDTALMTLASAGQPVDARIRWDAGANQSLIIDFHQLYLPRPKAPMNGPAGVMATFDMQAAQNPTLAKSMTVTLINDVSAY